MCTRIGTASVIIHHRFHMTWMESHLSPMLILINGDSGLIRTRRIWVLHTLAFPLGYRVIYVNRFPGLYLKVCCRSVNRPQKSRVGIEPTVRRICALSPHHLTLRSSRLDSNCCVDSICVSDNYVRQLAMWPSSPTGWYAGLLVPGTSRLHNNLDS